MLLLSFCLFEVFLSLVRRSKRGRIIQEEKMGEAPSLYDGVGDIDGTADLRAYNLAAVVVVVEGKAGRIGPRG